MRILKRLYQRESGIALPAALILLLLGTLLVVSSAVLVSTNLIANRVVDEADRNMYAAHAGIEYAYWKLKNDSSLSLPTIGNEIPIEFTDTVNGKTVVVNVRNQDGTTFRITSAPSDSSVTVISDVDLTFNAGTGLFDNALAGLSGNIIFGGNTQVTATTPMGADIYAGGSPGNIDLAGGCYVDGDASACGTINMVGGAVITGVQLAGAPPLEPPPGIDTWIQNHKSRTLTDPTWYTTPTISSPINANTTPTVSDRYRSSDLSITGNTSSTVTFTQPVWVTGNLIISSSGTVVFLQPVRVGGNISITSASTVKFESTVYVNGNLMTEKNAVIKTGDSMYVVGYISMMHNYNAAFQRLYINRESPVIAEGNISLTGNLPTYTGVVAADLPVIMSVNGNIELFGSSGSGARWIGAVLYAIYGGISLSENGLLVGCAIATTTLMTGNSSRIYYITGIGGRGDLPGGGGVGPTVTGIIPRTYTIQ